MKNRSKIERISLKLFLVFMTLCAASFLIAIWSGTQNEEYMKTVFTFFVIGLASFLIWLPVVVYKLIDALKGK